MEFKKSISAMLVFASICLVFGCSPQAPLPPLPTRLGLNFVISADGEVLLKRDGWTGFHPTSFGAVLHRGDQLQPAADARIIVLCENLTTWTVPGGLRSGLNNGCPQVSEPALVSGEGLIANTRGGVDPLIPYIISPRATKILDPMPVLRWNAVPGARTYTVQISGTNWLEQVEAAEFKYPGTPALQAARDFLLVIESEDGKSSKDEGLPGLGFSLLAEEQASRVREDAARIRALNLSPDATAFALAQLYAGHQLYAEAIELLEESAAANDQVTNVHRALGQLYKQVGLLTEAELHFLHAVEIAEKAVGDVESAAAAQAQLGEVYLAQGNNSEASRWLDEALAGYESLGDAQRASQIAAQLAEINR